MTDARAGLERHVHSNLVGCSLQNQNTGQVHHQLWTWSRGAGRVCHVFTRGFAHSHSDKAGRIRTPELDAIAPFSPDAAQQLRGVTKATNSPSGQADRDGLREPPDRWTFCPTLYHKQQKLRQPKSIFR